MGSAALQGDLWGAQSRNWAEIQERTFLPMYSTVFDVLNIAGQTHLLDVGCGAGLAAHRASAGCNAIVSGLDASEVLLAIARERVPNGDFRVGEMEALPYPDDAFDVVTGFNSFQYASEPVAALREAQRVTRKGGRVAMIVWGAPEQCEHAVTLKAVGSCLPPAPPGAGGPFALSGPGIVEGLLRDAGLTPSMSGEVACPFLYADLETAYAGIASAGPVTRAIRHSGEDHVRAAILASLEPFKKPDGTYLQHNIFRYVVGTK